MVVWDRRLREPALGNKGVGRTTGALGLQAAGSTLSSEAKTRGCDRKDVGSRAPGSEGGDQGVLGVCVAGAHRKFAVGQTGEV